jgi:hypothetical protein
MFRYLQPDKPAKAPRTNHGNPKPIQAQDPTETNDPDWYGEHQDEQDATNQDGHGEIGDSEWL